ncbi:MAG TPA: helicase C-terminal domain-containing protein, partial [Thermoleophilia bacterium]|nr:helicase C-terminal domain-containing protein [Thermoleophilia bacterium]
PLIAACLPAGFRWAVLMGRENYLCLRRLHDAIDDAGHGLPQPDRLTALAWLLARARRAEVDLSALPYGALLSLPALAELARELRSTSVSCLGRRCRLRGDCLWRLSRRRSQRAHLVCVNHALLLTGAESLPTFDDLVIDEAHLLPDEAVSAFSERVDARLVGDLLTELRGRRGHRPLAAAARAAAGGLPPDAAAALARAADGLESAARDLPAQATDLGSALQGLLAVSAAADGGGGSDDGEPGRRSARPAGTPATADGYASTLLITSGLQEQPAFDQVALASDTLAAGLTALAQAASLAADALPDEHRDKPRLVSTGADAAAAATVLCGATGLITPDDVCWTELSPTGTGGRRGHDQADGWAIERAPLSPAPLIRERLWERLRSGVLVSATLGVAGSFAYYRDQAGLAADLDVVERVFPSPFDYRRQTVLVLEHDPTTPYGASGRPLRLAERLRRLAEITGGRLLALFTNRRELEQVTALVGPHVEADGVVMLAQGVHGSAAALADEFRSHPATVLLGVDALWTGQDFPGDTLVCLVIARLPFPRQDARFEARRQAARADGRDWFREFYLPEAVLRFRQGFGRLIRTETDVGVVVVLDHRLTQKAYERQFLASLPDLEVLRVGPAELPDTVATALERLGALPAAVT